MEARGWDLLGTGIPGDCEPSNVDDGNRPGVFCKNKHSHRVIFPAPGSQVLCVGVSILVCVCTSVNLPMEARGRLQVSSSVAL